MLHIDQTEPGWFCFAALPKKEHIAAGLLRQDPAIECFCPRISYIKKTRRGKVRFVEPVFPGYLFLYADLQQHYRRIRAVHGIRDIIAFGGKIPSVPQAFIEALKQQFNLEDRHDLPAPVLRAGQKVVLTEGPFKDIEAIISGEVDARNRVRLLLEFLGQQLEIKVPAEQVFIPTEQPKSRIWDA